MKSAVIHRAFIEDMRRDDRFKVIFRARLREGGQGAHEVKVINLSPSGFCAKTSYSATVDSRVWLTIPGLEQREARVIWEQDFVFGCEFARPLHPAVFDHLSQRFGFR